MIDVDIQFFLTVHFKQIVHKITQNIQIPFQTRIINNTHQNNQPQEQQMKGRIYKNRLSSSSNDPQPYMLQSPMLYNHLYQQHQLPPSRPTFNLNCNYQTTGPKDKFTRNINNNINHLEQSQAFYKSPNGTIINKLYEKQKPSYVSVQSRAGMHKPSINQHMSALTDKLTMLQSPQTNNSRFLKRIVSNPDLHYSGQSIPQQPQQQQFIQQPLINNQQHQLMQDNSFLNNSITYNRSAMLSPSKMRNRTPVRKVSGNNFVGNDSSQMVNNNKRAFAYQVENNNNFSSGLAANTQMRTHIGPRSFHSATIPQSSPFIIPTANNDNPLSTTDYISSYQKRHKQRITALQSQHEMELHFYEEEIKAKDELIEEMSRTLREKEEIIKKLQSQNSNLTSRSYASFANCGNNSCRE